ncbi:iron ABC transporter permease [Paenibacillus sp. SC116]|nr:iron ABC transporter permease [Paenibacillus sp. SC116]
MNKRFAPWALLLGGSLLLACLVIMHIMQGAADLTPALVIEAIIAPQDTAEHHVVRSMRLPRVVAGILAGGALAVAGVLLQTITRNPLASAGTLGINAGAQLAVVFAGVFAPSLLAASSISVAFVGAAAAALFAYALSGGIRSNPLRMALAGMIVSMSAASVTAGLQIFFEEETSGLFLWGSGTLIQNDWSGISYAYPWIIVAVIVAFLFSRPLDVLLLNEETAQSLGQNVTLTRLVGLLIALVLAGVIVSIVGPIGFVGLVAPHLVRLVGVRNHRLLLPAAFLWGAVLLVGADVASRLAAGDSYRELPVGAVMAMIGGPCLAWLSYRAARRHQKSLEPDTVSFGTVIRKVPYPILLVIISLLLLGFTLFGLVFGGIKMSLSDIWNTLIGQGTRLSSNVILDHRIPRMLVAACAGAAFGVSGLMMQGVVRNPLADPSILGVSSGAGIGALSVLVVWPDLPIAFLPIAAFIGAITAAFLIYLIARRTGLQPAVLALVGIAVSAFGSAVIQLIVVQSKMNTAMAISWLSGSTYARGWDDLAQLVIWPATLVPAAWLVGRKLDVLGFGSDVPTGLGINVVRTRLRAALIGVALAAAAVAIVGTIGFIGLIAPHAARLLVGHNHRKLVPFTALIGAALLVLADAVGRSIMPPAEIPSGLVVAIIGAPYFLWLMRSTSRR